MAIVDGDPNAIIYAELKKYRGEMCLVETTAEGSRDISPVTPDGKVDLNRLGHHIGSRREVRRVRQVLRDTADACHASFLEMSEMYPLATGEDLTKVY